MTCVSVRPHKQYPAEPEAKYTSVTEVIPRPECHFITAGIRRSIDTLRCQLHRINETRFILSASGQGDRAISSAVIGYRCSDTVFIQLSRKRRQCGRTVSR